MNRWKKAGRRFDRVGLNQTFHIFFSIFYFPIHFGNTNKRNKDQNNDDDEQNNDHHEQDNDDDAENDNYVDLMSVFAHRAASHELEVAHLSNL